MRNDNGSGVERTLAMAHRCPNGRGKSILGRRIEKLAPAGSRRMRKAAWKWRERRVRTKINLSRFFQPLAAREPFMSYKLTIDKKPTYLHFIVTGRNSKENVARYLAEIRRECMARNCFRVLIEERLEGPRLGTVDVFHIAAEGSLQARSLLKAVAYVDVNAEGNLMKFAETVALNRALPVAVFSTVADAERWLLNGEIESPTPADARSRATERRR